MGTRKTIIIKIDLDVDEQVFGEYHKQSAAQGYTEAMASAIERNARYIIENEYSSVLKKSVDTRYDVEDFKE